MIGLPGYLPVRPVDNELLSSFLTRFARFNGSPPYRFFSHHVGRHPIWDRDIDRTLTAEGARRLALLLGLPIEQITAMSLQAFEAPLCRPQKLFNQGIGPWVNAVGVYHRVRRRYGLQFCPECLLEREAAFIKPWRLSFVTACSDHRRILSDSCPFCDAPVIPHRSHGALHRCYSCQHFLATWQPSDGALVDDALLIQGLYGTANSLLPESLRGISQGEILVGMRLLSSVLRRQGNGYLAYARPELRAAGNGPIELIRTRERIPVLLFQRDLLLDWPSSFWTVAEDYRLNQGHFADMADAPVWISALVAELPQAPSNAGTDEHARAPRPRHWRVRRAQQILKAVRRHV